jgi:hypothetical protein
LLAPVTLRLGEVEREAPDGRLRLLNPRIESRIHGFEAGEGRS